MMTAFHRCILVCLVGMSSACAPDAEVRSRHLAASTGDAYLVERNAWIEELRANSDERQKLQALVAQQAWNEADWRPAVTMAAVAADVSSSEVTDRLASLRGLNPKVYLAQRVPVINVGVELESAHLPAPSLIERYLHLDAMHLPATTGPAPATHTALRSGILFAVGRSGHPASLPFLRSVVLSNASSSRVRSEAARALGDAQLRAGDATGDHRAEETLEALIQSDVDTAVVTAAIQAVASLRSETALGILEAAALRPQPEIRSVAVSALGTFASPHAWHGVDPLRAVDLRRRAASTLVDGLRAALTSGGDAQHIQATVAAIAAANIPDAWNAAISVASGSATDTGTEITALLSHLQVVAIHRQRAATALPQ